MLLSSNRLADYDLQISPLCFSPNYYCRDEQCLDDMKRQLLVLPREEIVEKILNSLQVNYRTAPNVGVKIWMCSRRHLRSQYATLSFEPKTDSAGVYLDSIGPSQPWNFIFLSPGSNQPNLHCGRLRRPRKRFNVDSAIRREGYLSMHLPGIFFIHIPCKNMLIFSNYISMTQAPTLHV
ncbi:unnamed protein product [Hymenolepis diminuta]|uniref:Uncharacterized protein n=1 Tax=Hymenolepis diminuta TaxID=6216 RepID=A0A564Z099_HYMDI|nr:unnamed protein product [Hymenolepis diminuta]